MTRTPRHTSDPHLSMPSHEITRMQPLLLASSTEAPSERLALPLSPPLLQTPSPPARTTAPFSWQETLWGGPSRKRRACTPIGCTRGQNLPHQPLRSKLGRRCLAWFCLQPRQVSWNAYSMRSKVLHQSQLDSGAYSACLWVILLWTIVYGRGLAGLGGQLDAAGRRGLREINAFAGCPSGGSGWPCNPHLSLREPRLWY